MATPYKRLITLAPEDLEQLDALVCEPANVPREGQARSIRRTFFSRSLPLAGSSNARGAGVDFFHRVDIDGRQQSMVSSIRPTHNGTWCLDADVGLDRDRTEPRTLITPQGRVAK